MVIILLLNVGDNREVSDNFNGEKNQEREMQGYFKEGVVRSGKTSRYMSKYQGWVQLSKCV